MHGRKRHLVIWYELHVHLCQEKKKKKGLKNKRAEEKNIKEITKTDEAANKMFFEVRKPLRFHFSTKVKEVEEKKAILRHHNMSVKKNDTMIVNLLYTVKEIHHTHYCIQSCWGSCPEWEVVAP